MNNETYKALCQIIGEYYQDAMGKDKYLRQAMQHLCQLRDQIYPRWDARRFHRLGTEEMTEERRAKDYVVSIVEHHSTVLEADSAPEAIEKAQVMWESSELMLDETTFIEMEVTDAQVLEEQ